MNRGKRGQRAGGRANLGGHYYFASSSTMRHHLGASMILERGMKTCYIVFGMLFKEQVYVEPMYI